MQQRREALEEPVAAGAAEQHCEREPHAVRHDDQHERVRAAQLHELEQRLHQMRGRQQPAPPARAPHSSA